MLLQCSPNHKSHCSYMFIHQTFCWGLAKQGKMETEADSQDEGWVAKNPPAGGWMAQGPSADSEITKVIGASRVRLPKRSKLTSGYLNLHSGLEK